MSKPAKASAGSILPKFYEDFWIRFEVSPEKLRIFRFAFFALFALDAWLQIAHAPRYGYADFNVSHFPELDSILPVPTRSAMLLVYVLQGYLALRIALGGVSRFFYVALAGLFSGGYFVSQLNSYQHHYLLALALMLMVIFPWPDLAAKTETSDSDNASAANWPVRMLLVALSAMYFFAFITKLEGEWTDGSTLRVQLQADWIRSIGDSVGWSTLAVLTLLAELALCLLLHVRRLWPATIGIGVGMHLTFEFSGFDIGLFSYFMVALYVLLLPERWVSKLHSFRTKGMAMVPSLPFKDSSGPSASMAFALSLLLAGLLWLIVPLQSTTQIILAIAVLACVDVAIHRGFSRAAVHHLLAVLVLLGINWNTDSLRDYYRYWGGNERRSGNVEQAIAAYEKVVEIDPGYTGGRSNLGKLYRREGRDTEALKQFEAGMASSADHFGVHLGAAQLYHKLGRGADALRAAEAAVKIKPKNKNARTIRDYWLQKNKNNAPR